MISNDSLPHKSHIPDEGSSVYGTPISRAYSAGAYRNAEANVGLRRINEKQGTIIVDRVPGRCVSGEGMKVVWLLTRNAWFAPRAAETRPPTRPARALD